MINLSYCQIQAREALGAIAYGNDPEEITLHHPTTFTKITTIIYLTYKQLNVIKSIIAIHLAVMLIISVT